MATKQSDRVLAWAWAASLAITAGLMLRPMPDLANDLTSLYPRSDLVFHFGLFLYLRILPHATVWGRTRTAGISIALVGLGFALESAQSLTGTRTASCADALANTAGVFVGSYLGPLLEEVRGKHDR